MRKCMLMLGLVCLLALPVLAQRPGGGGFGQGDILSRPEVQKELKLTDEQKAAIKKAADVRDEAMKTAFKDKDREAMAKAGKEFAEAVGKVRKDLSSTQSKRLLGIEIQVAEKLGSARIFANAELQKELKLTDKQTETIKEVLSDLEKDRKELMDDAKGDRQKQFAAFQKLGTMSKEAYNKLSKQLTEEQAKTLKELQGEKVEINLGRPGGRPGTTEKPSEKKQDF